MEEIKVEAIEETEVSGSEDVKNDLNKTDYLVIGVIMAAGAGAYAGGRWLCKKSAPARAKVWSAITGIFSKKEDKSETVEVVSDHEESSKEDSKKGNTKKSEKVDTAKK